MKKFLSLIILSFLLLGSGCNLKTKYTPNDNTTQTPLDVNYSGMHLGCMETYNPLFCPESYKPPAGVKGLNYVK